MLAQCSGNERIERGIIQKVGSDEFFNVRPDGGALQFAPQRHFFNVQPFLQHHVSINDGIGQLRDGPAHRRHRVGDRAIGCLAVGAGAIGREAARPVRLNRCAGEPRAGVACL